MKFFKGYIGQREAVEMGENICNAIAEKRAIPLPALELTGNAGTGKSRFALALAEAMAKASVDDEPFTLITVNSVSSLPTLISQMVEAEGKRVIFFFDEAHAINKKILNFLKPILETEKQVKSVRYGEFTFTADPFKQLWIFASNENMRDGAMFGATGRAHQIQFVPYSSDEVKELIRYKAARWSKEFTLTDAAVDYLAGRVQPNGRAVSDLVEIDCLYMRGNITEIRAKELCKLKKRFPGGLRVNDIRTLLFLGTDATGKQVHEIASHCGGEAPADTQGRLQWLAGYGYVNTKAGKKMLSIDGEKYLAEIQAKQKAKKA